MYPAALLLALVLPFETIRPVLAAGGLSLSDEKLVLLMLVLAWVLQGLSATTEPVGQGFSATTESARQGVSTATEPPSRGVSVTGEPATEHWRVLPTPDEWRVLLPTLMFILVALVSARFAAEYVDDALRFTARLMGSAFALLVALRLGRDPHRARGLLLAVAIGGAASALLGLAEALRWPMFDPLLGLFKVAPTRVGGELRVSGSFQYATIAAMYFEMVAPLAIVLAATARRQWVKVLGVAIGMLCTADVVLSLTRAGMLTLGLVYAVVLAGALSRPAWRKLLVPVLASASVLLAGVVLLLMRDPVFDLRLVTESDADWYGATYSAPASLATLANQSVTVSVDVSNQGRMTWTSAERHPFALAYRWLTADGTGVLDVPPAEVPLSRDVYPGETMHFEARVGVPNLPAGSYLLDWGMLQHDVLRFYERGWADAVTRVAVDPAPDGAMGVMPTIRPRDDGEAPWVVGRLDLWRAALRISAANPLVGVGPDNFRHRYGAELGLEGWDERVHANNMYLEILADFGALGLAAFAFVVVPPLRAILRRAQSEPCLELGVGLAIAAFLVHGLLDSFLAFTPTALLFWILLGLAQVQKPQVSGR